MTSFARILCFLIVKVKVLFCGSVLLSHPVEQLVSWLFGEWEIFGFGHNFCSFRNTAHKCSNKCNLWNVLLTFFVGPFSCDFLGIIDCCVLHGMGAWFCQPTPSAPIFLNLCKRRKSENCMKKILIFGNPF